MSKKGSVLKFAFFFGLLILDLLVVDPIPVIDELILAILSFINLPKGRK